MMETIRPLAGVKVLEIATTIAGPACGRLLADFGADVIKLEPLSGDPVRAIGPFVDGISPFSAEILRGKRSIAVNLKTKQGLDIAKTLLKATDVVVENNRPGVMEDFGLSYETISSINSKIVMARISGYGQTGPYSRRPGYGAICEGLSGVRNMTGDPDRPPSRVALATTDYLAAMYASFGIVTALYWRNESGKGQVIDVALYEAAFSQMEACIGAYDKLGLVTKRQGPRIPGIAPNSLYHTKDNKYVLIAASSDSTFKRLAEAINMPQLLTDQRFNSVKNRGEPKNAAVLDELVDNWTLSRTAAEVESRLVKFLVPVSPVYTIADIFKDQQYSARNMLIDVNHPKLGQIKQHGIIPKFSLTPGSVDRAGPALGENTTEVLREIGYSNAKIALLRKNRVVL